MMTEVCVISFRRTQENGCSGCVSIYSCSRCNYGRLCSMCKMFRGESSYGAWNTRYLKGETIHIKYMYYMCLEIESDGNSILTLFNSLVSQVKCTSLQECPLALPL